MDKGDKTGLAGIFAGIGTAVIGGTVPFLFSDVPKWIWDILFWAGTAITIASIVWMIDAHFLSGKRRAVRMMPFASAVVVLAASVAIFYNIGYASVRDSSIPQWAGGAIIGGACGVGLARRKPAKKGNNAITLPKSAAETAKNIDFQMAIPVVDIVIDFSRARDPVPWLKFSVTLFNGSTFPLHAMSARGRLHAGAQEFHGAIGIVESTQFHQYGKFFTCSIKLPLNDTERTYLTQIDQSSHIVVGFQDTQIELNVYLDSGTRGVGVNLPNLCVFNMNNGRLRAPLYSDQSEIISDKITSLLFESHPDRSPSSPRT